ncbi:Dynein heavy chain, N-terminal region 1, putative [Angomonas deanei]|uniref:Dynein heavy chain, N-terminal region 1, putative n=1 Tax=Angomonas deanei TaxID=59799 RepID=A0A7G2C6L8_9TRYP|nr:Dynein heavy chain, N-terminal region 1, putative [Angomonas deanei]
MATTGLVAVQAQLTSTAQRHLQVRFGPVQTTRGDGWVLFQFAPIAEGDELQTEIQRLCASLARDATGRASLRLVGEEKEADFTTVAEKSHSFAKWLAKSTGDVQNLPTDLDSLPESDAVNGMLEMLYNDVALDAPEGIHGVTKFPTAMCPTGSRMDVILKGAVCIKAFTQTTLNPSEVDSNPNQGKRRKSNSVSSPKKKTTLKKDDDSDEEHGKLMNDFSLLQNSYSAVKLPDGPLAKVWIDTQTLSHAFSSYSSANIENELPTTWRSKAFSMLESHEVLKQVQEALKLYWNGAASRTERLKINAISLLTIVSGDIREYIKVQVALHGSDWRAEWKMDMKELQAALHLCKQWNRIVASLVNQDWKEWDGGMFHDESFNDFTQRVNDVVRIRLLVNSVTFLGESVPDAMEPEKVFVPHRMTDLRVTSQDDWRNCVAKFEKEFEFVEPKLRQPAKQKLFPSSTIDDTTVRQLQAHSALLQVKDIQSTLEKDIEALIQYLIKQMDGVKGRYENNVKRAKTDLQKLRVAKSCQAEVSSYPEVMYRVFGAGSPFAERVALAASTIVAETKRCEDGVLEQWCAGLEAHCKKVLAIEDAVTVQVDSRSQPTSLRCMLNPSIVQFVQEVQNIRSWAGEMPGLSEEPSKKKSKLNISNSCENTIRACLQLFAASVRTQQSVANFNTVLSQTIPSTTAMLHPVMERALSQILHADTKRRVISLGQLPRVGGSEHAFSKQC